MSCNVVAIINRDYFFEVFTGNQKLMTSNLIKEFTVLANYLHELSVILIMLARF